jgi:hypothetical protein
MFWFGYTSDAGLENFFKSFDKLILGCKACPLPNEEVKYSSRLMPVSTLGAWLEKVMMGV